MNIEYVFEMDFKDFRVEEQWPNDNTVKSQFNEHFTHVGQIYLMNKILVVHNSMALTDVNKTDNQQ